MSSQSSTRLRVAFVTNIIPDYRYPVFKALMDSGRYAIRIFCSVSVKKSCVQARINLPLVTSRNVNVRLKTKHKNAETTQVEPLPIPVGLLKDLILYRPDVVIAGEMGLRSLMCWVAARICRARFVLWSEEISTSAVGRSKLQHAVRRFLVKRADAFLAWGAPAQDYLRKLGAAPSQIFCCAQAIDNDYWFGHANRLDRALVRSELSIQGTAFLLVGRLLPLKGFARFLRALAALPRELRDRSSAVIVGDGELMQELQAIARENGLTNVRFAGNCAPDQLARYYAAADVFVFPSQVDVWGLVVNEALCFGLPVLASCHAGASQALIENTPLGKVFDPLNESEFVSHLISLIETPLPLDIARAQDALKNLNFECSVNAIERLLSKWPTSKLTGVKPCAQTQNL